MKEKDKSTYLIIVLFLLFLLLTFLIKLHLIDFVDVKIYEIIHSFRNKNLDFYFKNITKLGNMSIIFYIVFIFLIIKRNNYSLFLTAISIVSTSTMSILKNIIKRTRPDILRLINVSGYSYPSGHSMISVCVFGYLIYYILKTYKNNYLKYLLTTILSIIIISIGISRIYLGVHYFSDIIGGYLVSSIILIIFIKYKNNNLKR